MTKTKNKNHYRRLKFKKLKSLIQNEAITNLSKVTLNPKENELLLKGLSFIPSQNATPGMFARELENFIQKSYKAYIFKDISTPIPVLWTPSKFIADPPNDPQVNTFINKLKHYKNIFDDDVPLDPTGDIAILNNLFHHKDIIIKKADKGGGICIFDKNDYIHRAMEHLEDKTTYEEMAYDGNKDLLTDIEGFLETMEMKNILPKKIIKYITPHSPCLLYTSPSPRD